MFCYIFKRGICRVLIWYKQKSETESWYENVSIQWGDGWLIVWIGLPRFCAFSATIAFYLLFICRGKKDVKSVFKWSFEYCSVAKSHACEFYCHKAFNFIANWIKIYNFALASIAGYQPYFVLCECFILHIFQFLSHSFFLLKTYLHSISTWQQHDGITICC